MTKRLHWMLLLLLICGSGWLAIWISTGCAERRELIGYDFSAQVDAVGRIMDARCKDPVKITEKQCQYLLNQESRWERGEITQRQYQAEEDRIINRKL